MRAILASALLLSFVTLAAPAISAEAPLPCYGGFLCETLNELCGGCIPATAAQVKCPGTPCDEINEVCQRLGAHLCVA